MRTLQQRREAAAFKAKRPTKTDQSARVTTDLNVIINQFLKTGRSSSSGIPRYGDFSQLPTDLRGMIEQSRSITRLRANLPKALKELGIQELLALTPDQIAAILQPPANRPANKPAEAPE